MCTPVDISVMYNKLPHFNQFPYRAVTAIRGVGKTYPIQRFLLNEFLDKGQFFIYQRTTDIEAQLALDTGFWDVDLLAQPQYKRCHFDVKGNKILVNGIVAGIAIALTTAKHNRGRVLTGGQLDAPLDDKHPMSSKYNKDWVDGLDKHIKYMFYDEIVDMLPLSIEQEQKRYDLHKQNIQSIFRDRTGRACFMTGNLKNKIPILLEKLGFKEYKRDSIQKTYLNGKPRAVWQTIEPNDHWKAKNEVSMSHMLEPDDQSINKVDFLEVSWDNKKHKSQKLLWVTEFFSVYRLSSGYYIRKRKQQELILDCIDPLRATPNRPMLHLNIIKALKDSYRHGRIKFDEDYTRQLFCEQLKIK